MNREAKYRAWDGTIMQYDLIAIDFNDSITTGYHDGQRRLPIESVILMQYIGVKSKFKNGQLASREQADEIYESDIVRHQNGFIYIVEWDIINLKWCLVQPRTKRSRLLENIYTGGIAGQNIWRCEVLGNIYENDTEKLVKANQKALAKIIKSKSEI